MTKSATRTLASLLALAALGAACSDDTTGPGGPPAPTGLTIQQLSLTSVRVSWTAAAGATTYVLERASADDPGVFVEVSDAITATQYDDTGLTAGVAYSYRVAGVNADGQGDYSTTASVTIGAAEATLGSDVTASRTLYKDTLYTLSGYVKVQNGATLTIEAGTRIIGDTTVLGSSLWILRGAKINALGTAAEPIVFTSARAVGNRKPGDWGGIIIVGNATINRTGVATINTEGPAGEVENYAGGTDDADSSGVLRYVRIEFAGYDVSGTGQELNSLSSYAVGSGTKYEYIQSLGGLDDSFEFWGGAAQGRYLVSYESGDDHFDWSEGFRGKLQFLIAFQRERLVPQTDAGFLSSDPRGFEADGCEPGLAGCTLADDTASVPFSNPTIANFTLVGSTISGFPTDGNGMVLRRGTAGWLHNGIVAGYKGVGCQFRDAWTDSLRLRDSLNLTNMVFAENTGGNYDDDASASRYCQEAKWAGDNHRTAATAAAVLTSLATNGLDFTPPAASLPTTGGSTVPLPAGRTANFFGGSMTNTTYVGAVDPAGPKWWQGWTVYSAN
ncbi:MAG TPA: fibronectin type III domain-containing protein [Gemmatimonadales bacterium]